MGLECSECEKTLKDKRGAWGHVKFTDGDGHGDKGDVPDGWESLFPSLDAEDGGTDGSDDGTDTDQETDETTDSSGLMELLDFDIMDLLR